MADVSCRNIFPGTVRHRLFDDRRIPQTSRFQGKISSFAGGNPSDRGKERERWNSPFSQSIANKLTSLESSTDVWRVPQGLAVGKGWKREFRIAAFAPHRTAPCLEPHYRRSRPIRTSYVTRTNSAPSPKRRDVCRRKEGFVKFQPRGHDFFDRPAIVIMPRHTHTHSLQPSQFYYRALFSLSQRRG